MLKGFYGLISSILLGVIVIYECFIGKINTNGLILMGICAIIFAIIAAKDEIIKKINSEQDAL